MDIIRQKLHGHIDVTYDIKIEALYTLHQNDLGQPYVCTG